ncbi:MAG: hypothetical protein QM723_14210 [Myxococcaceae bacterium]
MEAYLPGVVVATALAAGVVLLRVARAAKLLPTKVGRCEVCRDRRPVLRVAYSQNTGLLVMRRTEAVKGQVCRSCSLRTFVRFELHTLFLGWWGLISALVTPIDLVTHFACLLGTLGFPSFAAHGRTALDEHRDYARNLLATKDEATVIDVLARTTGATRDDVAQFLRTVERP